jgi:hypothetical protein
MSNPATRLKVLVLYKQILKACKTFPSKNKLRLLKEIRDDFRINRNLKNETEVGIAIERATKGLSQLNVYSTLSSKPGNHWSVQLESNPMPRPDGG